MAWYGIVPVHHLLNSNTFSPDEIQSMCVSCSHAFLSNATITHKHTQCYTQCTSLDQRLYNRFISALAKQDISYHIYMYKDYAEFQFFPRGSWPWPFRSLQIKRAPSVAEGPTINNKQQLSCVCSRLCQVAQEAKSSI